MEEGRIKLGPSQRARQELSVVGGRVIYSWKFLKILSHGDKPLASIFGNMYVYGCVCIYLHIYVSTCVCMYMCHFCVSTHMYVYEYMCMYVGLYM